MHLHHIPHLFAMIIASGLLSLSACTPTTSGHNDAAKADSLATVAKADSLAQLAAIDSADNARTAEGATAAIGVDVSETQGQIDWAVAKTEGKIAFAYARATMGSSGVDAQLARNWPAIQREGIPRGAYHHYKVGDDIAAQVKNFGKHVKLETGDLHPAILLDQASIPNNVRLDKKGVVKAISGFLMEMEKAHGCKPLIFTDKSFAGTYLDAASFADYPLWIRSPGDKAEPILPATWDNAGWKLWLFGDHGSIPGFPENVSRSKFYGSPAQLPSELACAKP